jgi:hypothetical protein
MALAVTISLKQVWGTRRVFLGTLAFDSSYPTGGEALPAGFEKFNLAKVDYASIGPHEGFIFEYDATNDKVLAYFADYSTGTDGALIQVADTTDLSGQAAVPFFVIGY